MNRTDRLYALVEELRAVSPRPRSAAWLARRFEVSTRTVERDLDALRESGVAIRGDTGRTGGYSLDRDRTLPPLTLTPAEALAVGVALAGQEGPFAAAARTAAQKVQAVLPADVRRAADLLATQVRRFGGHPAGPAGPGSDEVLRAVATGRLVRLDYADARGIPSVREVEPMGLLWGPHGWYLMGWCRTRDALRGFRLDRLRGADLLDEHPPLRADAMAAELARLEAEPLVPQVLQ